MNREILNKLSTLLASIDDKAYKLYVKNLSGSINYVNNHIKQREDLNVLIGLNSFELVEMNHKNHAEFMKSIFLIKDALKMHETYIWAYQTYHAKGFDFRYFYLELTAWKESFEKVNDKSLSPVISLYSYLISLHDYFMQHAISYEQKVPKNVDIKVYNDFLDALLKPDLQEAITISNSFIKTYKDIRTFWEGIILPALYSIGNKWAMAEISVAQEHIATSICQRVMAEHYPKIIPHIKGSKKILVTTGPNELHEVGARVLSDILELNGYDVDFLPSSSSVDEKLYMIKKEKIEFLVISVTLTSNIPKTQRFIAQIREQLKHDSPTIILGGQAFRGNRDGYNMVQADYIYENINELLALFKRFIRQ
jgi:methanogenic corrinoid protein MtbC1